MTMQLSTRKGLDGLIRRRYETEDGRRYNTFELPETVVRALGITTVRGYLRAWKQGEEIRARAAKLRYEVSLRDGWKATAVAHDLGVTEARVRQIRKEFQDGDR